MNVPKLISHLESLGVRLWEDSGRLRYRAPKGVMTEPWLAALRDQKAAVLDYLRRGALASALTPEPATRHEPFPLTDMQSAYILGRRELFAYGGVACHAYGEV